MSWTKIMVTFGVTCLLIYSAFAHLAIAALTSQKDQFERTKKAEEDRLDRRKKALEQELVKIGIPVEKAAAILNPKVPEAEGLQTLDSALLKHLAIDNRPQTGATFIDRVQHKEKGHSLTLDNGLEEDACVKLVSGEKLVSSFYVRSHEKFAFSRMPDGVYQVLYCTGYGWKAELRDFERERHARRYDDLLSLITGFE